MASSSAAGSRDYKAAVEALNTLQSNFAVVDAIRKSGRGMNTNAIPEMVDWVKRIGYEPSDFDSLSAIHIAGTKGKGSTSAFISSILSQYLPQPSPAAEPRTSVPTPPASAPLTKIGLYTSPHLRFVRERICINNIPLSEPLFALYFWQIWDRLEAYAAIHGPQDLPLPSDVEPIPELVNAPKPTKPVYFRYLTLMALHAYVQEGVRPAVIECGIGGEYDSTNILARPAVCAVTSLGIDHTAVLGSSIEEIAWHKSGIFKEDGRSRDVYTVHDQPTEAMEVLRTRADEKGLRLVPVKRHRVIEEGKANSGETVRLGLRADFQKTNASLAVAVAAAWLKSAGILASPSGVVVPEPGNTDSELPPEFLKGLSTVQWGGRCEVRKHGRVKWCLDGGHTIESMRLAGQWFGGELGARQSDQSRMKQKRVLLFNQQTRDAVGLARTLHTALRETVPVSAASTREAEGGQKDEISDSESLFHHALFSTNITFSPTAGSAAGSYKPDLLSMNTSGVDVEKLTVQKSLAEMWQVLDRGCETSVEGSIEDAVRRVRELERTMRDDEEVVVLVTGSLHLVGGCLEVLDTV